MPIMKFGDVKQGKVVPNPAETTKDTKEGTDGQDTGSGNSGKRDQDSGSDRIK